MIDGGTICNRVIDLEDATIIDLFFKRDDTAIRETQAKYGKLCLYTARNILPDERDAEECAGDTLLRLWNAIPPERPRSLGAYIARVTRNLALDRYAYNSAEKRSTALTEAFEELEPMLSGGDVAQRTLEEREFKRFMGDFLRRQSREARIFFVRRYYYGESVREIAEDTDVTEEKVKSSLFRTRNRLREALKQEGTV